MTKPSDAYDVNVSPDKRTILLHDQNILLESLKVEFRNLILEAYLTRLVDAID